MLAVKSSFYLGKYSVDCSTTGVKAPIPAAMLPTIGPIAAVVYKTAMFRFDVEGAGAAEGTITLKAGSAVLASGTIEAGAGALPVDLGTVQGSTPLEIEMNVATVGDAGASVQARIDIEQPVVTGC